MRNRILGGIGMLVGGTFILRICSGGERIVTGSGAYGAGQTAGAIFLVLFFVVGTYYFIKG